MDLETIKAAMLGVIVGDALGVPVEFMSRMLSFLVRSLICGHMVPINSQPVLGQMTVP